MANNPNAAVQHPMYGVGFSPTSVHNKAGALAEEMLANKDIGLFYIMTTEGNLMSAEFLARTKRHLSNFVQRCYNEGTLGKIYQIRHTDNLVRSDMHNDDNLLTNIVPIVLPNNEPGKAIRFSFDIDVVQKAKSSHDLASQIGMQIGVSLTKNGTEKHYTINESIEDINVKAYAIDMEGIGPDEGVNTYKVTIDHITFKVPVDFNVSENTIILYNSLVCVV